MGEKNPPHHLPLSLCYSSKGGPRYAFTPGVSLWGSEQRKQKPKHWWCPEVRDLDLKAQRVIRTHTPEGSLVCLADCCVFSA